LAALPKGKETESIFGALHNGAYRNGKLHYFGHPAVVLCEKGMKETIGGRKHDLGPTRDWESIRETLER
jgi:hypothetical protein